MMIRRLRGACTLRKPSFQFGDELKNGVEEGLLGPVHLNYSSTPDLRR